MMTPPFSVDLAATMKTLLLNSMPTIRMRPLKEGKVQEEPGLQTPYGRGNLKSSFFYKTKRGVRYFRNRGIGQPLLGKAHQRHQYLPLAAGSDALKKLLTQKEYESDSKLGKGYQQLVKDAAKQNDTAEQLNKAAFKKAGEDFFKHDKEHRSLPLTTVDQQEHSMVSPTPDVESAALAKAKMEMPEPSSSWETSVQSPAPVGTSNVNTTKNARTQGSNRRHRRRQGRKKKTGVKTKKQKSKTARGKAPIKRELLRHLRFS